MKAIIYKASNSKSKTITIDEVPTPDYKENEILVKVVATAVTPTDVLGLNGTNAVFNFIEKIFNSGSIPGDVFSGEVTEVGEAVSSFKPGDKVFGTLAPSTGTHAEYIAINEDRVITQLPSSISEIEAAALVDGPLTAYAFLTKIAQIKKDQSILINGASGSVGCAAVELAKYLGAEVTAVCSGKNTEFIKSLGADTVIDYEEEDFTKLDTKFDFVFDAVNKSSFKSSKNILKERGMYMTTGPSLDIIVSFIATRFQKQNAVMGATGPFWKKADLEFIRDRIEEGDLKPHIDSEYTFDNMADAHARTETGHKVGSVVVRL